jgi:hypothetical protein
VMLLSHRFSLRQRGRVQLPFEDEDRHRFNQSFSLVDNEETINDDLFNGYALSFQYYHSYLNEFSTISDAGARKRCEEDAGSFRLAR